MSQWALQAHTIGAKLSKKGREVKYYSHMQKPFST